MTIVYDLSIEQYHADRDSISKSGLDLIDKCPAIFHAWQSTNAPKRESKPGQLEGHLAHCAILEPEEFSKRYVVGPAVNRNTKIWKEFVEANELFAIQPDQYEAAMRQGESVRALHEIREALARGRAEVSAFWTDSVTGVQCRCRPDFVHEVSNDSAVLLDVKTYSSASAHEFRKQCAKKRYFVQDALYSDGYATASGLDVLAFVFVAVETEYPYAASAMMLDPESKRQGRLAYLRNLSTYAECARANTWPGYGDLIQMISLPNWAFTE